MLGRVLVLAALLAGSVFAPEGEEDVTGCTGGKLVFSCAAVSPTANTDLTVADIESDSQGGGSSSPDACYYELISHPGSSDPRWGTNDPNNGELYGTYCPVAIKIDGSATERQIVDFVGYTYAVNGLPPAPPPPSAADLAQQALDQMPIPEPVLEFGPSPEFIAVKYWTVLSIEDPGSLTLTVSAGGVSVTAVASITSVTWSMGEPVDVERPWILAEPITCQGVGITTTTELNPREDPPAGFCAYKYNWKSTENRTDGVGKWPVQATAQWTIEWSSNTDESGILNTEANGNSAVQVGEWNVVIVPGPGG